MLFVFSQFVLDDLVVVLQIFDAFLQIRVLTLVKFFLLLITLLQFLETGSIGFILLFQIFEIFTILFCEFTEFFVLRFILLLLFFFEICNNFIPIIDFGLELFVLLIKIMECLFDFQLDFLDIFVD